MELRTSGLNLIMYPWIKQIKPLVPGVSPPTRTRAKIAALSVAAAAAAWVGQGPQHNLLLSWSPAKTCPLLMKCGVNPCVLSKQNAKNLGVRQCKALDIIQLIEIYTICIQLYLDSRLELFWLWHVLTTVRVHPPAQSLASKCTRAGGTLALVLPAPIVFWMCWVLGFKKCSAWVAKLWKMERHEITRTLCKIYDAYISVYIYVCVYVYYIYICVCVCLSVCVSVCVSVCNVM